MAGSLYYATVDFYATKKRTPSLQSTVAFELNQKLRFIHVSPSRTRGL